MSLYRDGLRAYFLGRHIDAYNNFYLFLETQFCGGQSKTAKAVEQLIKSTEFTSALGRVAVDELKDNDLKNVCFPSLQTWPTNQRQLVKEIVELRGKLRHHSLGNPHRWDPNNQDQFGREAHFISLIANEIAFPKTTGLLWEPSLLSQYSELAKSMHMAIEVRVVLTIKEDERARDVGIDMTFPQPQVDASLAKAILSKAFELFDERFPAGELLAVRAWTTNEKREVLRYDLGPSIPR